MIEKKFKTSDTFTSVDGKVVRFADVYEGIVQKVHDYVESGKITELDGDDIVMSTIADFCETLKNEYDSTLSQPRTFGGLQAHYRILKYLESSNHTRMVPFSSCFKEYEEDFYDDSIVDSSLSYYDAEMHYDQKELIENLFSSSVFDNDVNRRIVEMTGCGYKPSEIAKDLGITNQAVYNRLNRIRKVLKPMHDAYLAA